MAERPKEVGEIDRLTQASPFPIKRRRNEMKINLSNLMRDAWRRYKDEENRHSFATCLKLAWMAAKGNKGYCFHLEAERTAITAYLLKLLKLVREGLADIHDEHKIEIIRAALLRSVDRNGIAVLDGKTVGICKYAIRNAA